MRQAPAGRTAGTQRPDAAKPAGVAAIPGLRACGAGLRAASRPRPPAREAPCLSRQVVQRAAERAKPEGKTRGVDRVVGRGRAGDGKRLRSSRGWRCAETRSPPAACGRSNAAADRTTARQGVRGGAAGPALGRKPRGITMPVPMPLRRIVDVGLGLRGRGRRQGDDDPARGHDDQPPRRGFGRAQQAEHGTVEMARQGGRATAVQPGHGDEHGQHALQRLAVLLDCRIPVHRRLPSRRRDCSAGWEGVEKVGGKFRGAGMRPWENQPSSAPSHRGDNAVAPYDIDPHPARYACHPPRKGEG